MPEVSFQPPSISNSIGKLRIDIEGISGQGGPVYPQLFVLLQITLKSADVHSRVGMGVTLPTPEDLIQDYSLHQIYGTLFFGSQGGATVQVANFQSLPISHFSRTSPEAQVNLAIPLDLYRLRLIEAQRVGDVVLRFDFTFHYAKHYQIPRKQANSPIERFESNYIQFTISIPQSHWVTKVQPGLGYGKISLVEVPTPQSALGETIKGAVTEFEQAQTYLLSGDYNKALGHCRNALEILSNAVEYKGAPKNGRKDPSFADKIDYLLDVLPGAPTGFRRENLARMCKDLYGFTSPPQHPSPPDFTRDDAEMTWHITLALLSYLGKCLARTAQEAAMVSVAST